MGLVIETTDGNDTLTDMQTAIGQKESYGYELLSLARGTAKGADANFAVFRDRRANDPLGPLMLKEIKGSLSREDQEGAINDGEIEGAKLISYGGLIVEKRKTNVAAYRQKPQPNPG